MCLYRHSTRCPTMRASSRDLDTTADVRDDALIQRFIGNLPVPPSKYKFSHRQYHQQYAFFQLKRELVMPNLHLDLYNAKIIAVRRCTILLRNDPCSYLVFSYTVPETASTVLRQTVEALFITHTESKLNSSGDLVNNYDAPGPSIHHPNIAWCEGLVRRPCPTFVSAKTEK